MKVKLSVKIVLSNLASQFIGMQDITQSEVQYHTSLIISTFITDTVTVGLLIWLITESASLSAIFPGIIAGVIISIFAPK